MAGHSKWAQIKHKKASTDARRAQLFSKLARVISVAAREKGGDPTANPTLASAIEKARSYNMPNENIERAIQKGAGSSDSSLEEFTYEAYGPGGVAIMITGITDNNNRTSQEVKHILKDSQGKWAEPGSVRWAFEKTAHGWDLREFTRVAISVEDSEKLMQLLGALDDHDDIQDVFTNEQT